MHDLVKRGGDARVYTCACSASGDWVRSAYVALASQGGGCPSRVQLEGLAVGGVEVPRKLAGSWKRSPASEREQQSPSRWHSDTLSRSQRSTRSSDGMLEGRPCRDLALQDLAREVRSPLELELHPQQRRPLAPLALQLLPLLR